MLYHGVNAGNSISTSADKNLDNWNKLPANPIIPNPPPGAPYASWDPHGWSGVMSLPRVLSLDKDGKLLMQPIEELERLCHNEQNLKDLKINTDTEYMLDQIQGNIIELLVEMVTDGAKQCGIKVCCSPDGTEQTLIYYDAVKSILI